MSESKFAISRRFTNENSNPYDGIEFVEWTSRVTEESGKSIAIRTVIAPSFWSQTAVDIMAQKYLRKAGIPRFLKKVPEANMPSWLYRSAADEVKLDTVTDKYTDENDCRMLFHRLAGTWTYWGWKGGYLSTEASAKSFYDEICHMLVMQKAAPNSPQFFNTGIHWAYGITGGAQGHYYFDENDNIVKKSSSAYEKPQVHACFIQSIEDNLIEDGGILDLAMRESRIFKFGSGSGSNFSTLRSKGESLSGGGKSSGLMSFLKIGDAVAGAIKSGGTTRRAAKMVTVDSDHPEILDYVSWKVKEENKLVSLMTGSRIVEKHLKQIVEAFRESNDVDLRSNLKLAQAVADAYHNEVPAAYLERVLAMLAQGILEFDWEVFTSDFNGAGYSSLNGQNSNNSVRVSNKFMNASRSNQPFSLNNRTNGQAQVTLNANEVMEKIALASWICADPGIQYDDTINEWHTCPNSGRINASNPCSEYMFLNNTACNLASINLVKFETAKNGFDTDGFAHATRLWTLVLEISVYMAQYPSEEIARLSHEFRTLGLGYANLGALLMRSGIPYDSDEGRAIAAYITAVLHGISYETSADLAGSFGPFVGFSANREHMLRVIENHRRAILGEKCIGVTMQPVMLDKTKLSHDQLKYLTILWDTVVDKGRKYGFRNAQTTLLAPTGTIGLLMDCDTTGVEPDYAIVKHKKLAGGGYMKIVNNSVEHALQNIGYNHEQIKDIINYIVGSGSFDHSPKVNRVTLMKRGLTEAEIDRVTAGLKSAFSISSLFSPWTLGEDAFKRLGIPSESIHDSNFNLLEFLGFSQADINEANLAICGHMCIEGAPHIKEKDLPIFDCANKNGAYGKRYISVDGHLSMMAAVQPFLSGAISKTVNMPKEATIADCRHVYMKGWELGLKALALFRSDSKLASALSSGGASGFRVESSAETRDIARGAREVLPAKRTGYTQRVTIGGTNNIFYHTTGENEAGDIREILVTGGDKEGMPFRSIMSCFAKAVSIGLQYGVPIEVMVDAFIGVRFAPNGLVTGHPDIRFASSVVDYMLRDLGINYRNMKHLCQSNNKPTPNEVVENRASNSYTGDICCNCGSFRMVRDGTCSYCEECGTTTGCGG